MQEDLQKRVSSDLLHYPFKACQTTPPHRWRQTLDTALYCAKSEGYCSNTSPGLRSSHLQKSNLPVSQKIRDLEVALQGEAFPYRRTCPAPARVSNKV